MAGLPVDAAASLLVVVALGERLLVDHERGGLGKALELGPDVLGPDGGSFRSFASYCSCTPQATGKTSGSSGSESAPS
jgi:hypothetical protein